MKALESGNSVLKSLTEKTSVDHVTDVMDELAEVLMAMYNVKDFLIEPLWHILMDYDHNDKTSI